MSAALDIILRDAGDGPAAARLREIGLPTPKVEDWKFTSLRPLEKFLTDGGAAGKAPAVPTPLIAGAAQIVIRNGRVEGDFSTVNGISVNTTEDDLDPRSGSAVSAMVAALAQGSLGIRIDRNAAPETPLEIVFLSDGTEGPAHHVSIAIEAGENSEALLIERHLGDGAYLNANAVSVALGQNARLRHVKVQDDSRNGFHLADVTANLGRDATYSRFILSLGSRLARDEVHTLCGGAGCELWLHGAYAGAGDQHLDHTTRIDHAVPNTSSHEVYKGVLDDRSRGVFQGGILVRPDAQKTDGHQLNKALLLSPKAEIDSKPALEIFADDVKCSHGATTGEIDGEQLFYLRARGVPEEEARTLLVQAFLDEIFDNIPEEELREALIRRLHEKLGLEDAANG
jgi:Fe-S cluster assembly protein SufD